MNNNLNNFLLEISTPLINFLQSNTHNFVSEFESVCKNNSLFQQWKTSPASFSNLENQIFELTGNYLMILSFMADYVGCECHKKSDTELQQEFDDSFNKYIIKLLQHIEKGNFLDFSIPENFKSKYTIALNNLLSDDVTINVAEKFILFSKDEIPEDILEKILLNLRYTYIKRLINK